MFAEEDAWELVEELKSQISRCPTARHLHVVYHWGSLTRGEFDPAHSEVDPIFIFRTPQGHAATGLLQGLQFIKDLDRKWRAETGRTFPCVDIGPWYFYDSLPLKGSRISPESMVRTRGSKAVTVFAFDFVKHAQLLFGEDIRDRLVVRDPRELTYLHLALTRDFLRVQLQGVSEEWALREARSGYRVKCSTFEAARTLYVHFGERTLAKTQLIANFDRAIPDFPSKDFFASSLLREYRDPDYLARLTADKLVEYFEGSLRFVEGATSLVAGRQ